MTFWSRIQKKLSPKSREKKFKLFMEKLSPKRESIVLNVGGSKFFSSKYPFSDKVVVVNTSFEEIKQLKKTKNMLIIADGCFLPIKDNSVDIVFSNAVIEHVGNFRRQKLFAKEIKRVAKEYFIVTPNKWFFFELHYHLPFYQFVPKRVQRFFSKHFRIGGHPRGYWIDLNLLDKKSLQNLFPEAKVIGVSLPFYPETLIAFKSAKNHAKT